MNNARLRLLICDDELELLSLYTEALEADFEMATARDPAESLALAKSFSPHIVLMDLHLTRRGDGLTLYLSMREQDPKLLCVLITGYVDRATVDAAARSGIFGFIEKPFELGELYSILKKAETSILSQQT